MNNYDMFIQDNRCFVDKLRITGIFQTGKRRFIRDNTFKSDELTLKREYDNKYDDNAVAVYDRYGNKTGYLERNANEETAFYMDSGYECIAVVSDIDKTGATVGISVNVFCIADKETMKELKARYEEYLRSQIQM